MKVYASTFVAGCQEIVSRKLKEFTIDRLRILYLDDSFIIFESDLPSTKLTNLRFFNNIFLVIGHQPNTIGINELVRFGAWKLNDNAPNLAVKGKSFRILATAGNSLTSINPKAREEFADAITKAYNLNESSHRPDIEFWCFLRKSKMGVAAIKLLNSAFKKVKQPAGSLQPELAHLLGLVAGVGSHDIVLDPFAGSGAILQECRIGFHAKKLIAAEVDSKLVKMLKETSEFEVKQSSASNLSFLADNSINRVITDPPWGKFGNYTTTQLNQLYLESISEIQRVLKSGGIAVILSGATYIMQRAIENTQDLVLVKSYPILVAGQKSTIYKLRKN